MAHMMKKSEFLALAATMKDVVFHTFRGSVYVRDGKLNTESQVEIYRASNMKEEGITCSMNQRAKYAKWLADAKA